MLPAGASKRLKFLMDAVKTFVLGWLGYIDVHCMQKRLNKAAQACGSNMLVRYCATIKRQLYPLMHE